MRLDRAVLFKLATNERLEQLVKGVPGGEDNAWRAASRYVAGRTREEALEVAAAQLAKGHGISVDLFGELSEDPDDAARVVDEYLELATLLPAPPADAWLSLDLSHLALDADAEGAADLVARIAEALPPGRRLQIGAEDIARTDRIQQCVLNVAARGLADRLGATVQANLLRSPDDIDALTAAGVHIRLVKGAYVEPTGAHPYGEPTDIAYLRLAHQLASSKATWSLATHDGRLREAVLLSVGTVPVEQLLGVRPDVLDQLRDRDIPTRVYIPYGPAWFRYWLRRVAESRGA
ncbi:L-proline dehydrogenase [Kribbella voronezhensis]|uniref:L-proline dehydrogenase n=1 Tax=Kribbella voronezhensis TaxID=2512212 RepID=A0A4R7TEC5_9ACTN|nr:proline dehydrogenase family protein [Kribbella voronezhensis]TDU89758.1 L-proline dehydrogenase [Kribbella voronezhensis]